MSANTLKLASEPGQKYFDLLKSTKIGKSFNLPSPLPGIDNTKTQAFLMERDQDRWFKLDLYWQGIFYAEVTAEVQGDKIIFEDL